MIIKYFYSSLLKVQTYFLLLCCFFFYSLKSFTFTHSSPSDRPRGQHGVAIDKLHRVNTFFTHSTAGMCVSLRAAFFSCSLNTHACINARMHAPLQTALCEAHPSAETVRSSPCHSAAVAECLTVVGSFHFNTSSVFRGRRASLTFAHLP